MECKDAKIKASALIDNEIDEKDVPPLISHLESCYTCREEYMELLRLQRDFQRVDVPHPSKEWFETLPKKIIRKSFDTVGKFIFFASYLLLLGYGVYSLFAADNESLFVKLLVGGAVGGFLILFGVTVFDRLTERKTDKYRGVMK